MSVLDDPRVAPSDGGYDEAGYVETARPGHTPAGIWRAARAPLAIAAFALVGIVMLTLLTGTAGLGAYYPDSAAPEGGRAVARLLAGREVDIRRTALFEPGGGRQTVFVPDPRLVDNDELADAGNDGDADIVIVDPRRSHLRALGITRVDPRVSDRAGVEALPPACALREADVAGEVTLGGTLYDAPTADHRCYADTGGAALVVYDLGRRRVVVLGSGEFLTNRRLDEQGNAALALGLLGRHPRLQWLQPQPDEIATGETATDRRDIGELTPDWVTVLTMQLVVAGALAAWWRARRLGPVVTERLPVVVRAAEAVEGRGRLYLAARARGRAASALREATRDRLVAALGLGRDAGPPAIVDAIAARAGRPAAAVEALLYGPAPADDASLVRLADSLDVLNSEVLTP